MRRALPLVFLLLAACAGPRAARLASVPRDAFGDRLVERAETWLGEDGPFVVGDARYGADCSGFVQAVFAALRSFGVGPAQATADADVTDNTMTSARGSRAVMGPMVSQKNL